MSIVWLIQDNFLKKLETLIKKTKFSGSVPIKVHMGEYGNIFYVRPAIVERIVKIVKENGGKPFLFDTLPKYQGERDTVRKYQRTARRNGFTKEGMGCEIKIFGENELVPMKTKNLTLYVPKRILKSKQMLVISHGKGHAHCAGFGGAIKNIGMGCVGKKTKKEMHTKPAPDVDYTKCIKCGKCVAVCPKSGAVLKITDRLHITKENCIGCWRCIRVCPTKALSSRGPSLNALIAEGAKAVLKNKRIIYVTVLIDIVDECDCCESSRLPDCEDIGFLVSSDPVAIDKAAIDLIEKSSPNFFKKMGIDYMDQVKHGEKIKLGKMKYRLVKV